MLLLALGWPDAAAAQGRLEVATIAGQLRAVCLEGRHGTVATYALNGQRLTSLDHGCTEGARSGLALRGTWESPRATTLLMAVPADEGLLYHRLLRVSADGAPLLMELDASFPVSGGRLSTNRFRLVQYGRNEDGDEWDCQYDVDFAMRTLSWRVTRTTDPGIADWICGAELRDVPFD